MLNQTSFGCIISSLPVSLSWFNLRRRAAQEAVLRAILKVNNYILEAPAWQDRNYCRARRYFALIIPSLGPSLGLWAV